MGQPEDEISKIKDRMKKVSTEIEQLNQAIVDLADGIMSKIGDSTDEVSRTLYPLFAKAKPHNDDELRRAKNRKELGNPLGKIKDPIGDQLNWEQILSQFTSKSKLWIISRDGDYISTYGKRLFLKQFLYNELRKISPSAEAFVFTDIVEGIKNFANMTKVKAYALPTAAQEAKIKKEIEALPPPVDLIVSAASLGIKASVSNHWEGKGIPPRPSYLGAYKPDTEAFPDHPTDDTAEAD
jgi:hypothetical protein